MKKLLIGIVFLGFCYSTPYLQMGQISFAKELTETQDDMIENNEDEEEASLVAIDTYKFKLSLSVPQVFSNTASLGYRKYKKQVIRGYMYINWLDDGTFYVNFSHLVNHNFKVGNLAVSYEGYEDKSSLLHSFTYIGDNKKNVFKKPCLCFQIELLPSYAIGEPTSDNSFRLVLAGSGKSKQLKFKTYRITKKISGFASGTQGCSCSAYGHKSPTRLAGVLGNTDEVNDVVATWGRWQATFIRRNYSER